MTDDEIILVGSILSLICSATLIGTWCLIPQWRTLLNYVTMNQVIAGTFQLCAVLLLNFELSDWAIDLAISMSMNFFFSSLSWSLCASMISYFKLVLIHPGKIACGKRKATLFSCSVLFLLKCVTKCLIPQMFQLKKYASVMVVEVLAMYIIISVNMFVFLKIVVTVMPCYKKRMFRPRGGNVIPLIGVGFVCDLATTLCMLLRMIQLYAGVEGNKINIVMAFRLIPQALVLLFNRRSRDIWRIYLRRNRNIRLNNMTLVQNIRG